MEQSEELNSNESTEESSHHEENQEVINQQDKIPSFQKPTKSTEKKKSQKHKTSSIAAASGSVAKLKKSPAPLNKRASEFGIGRCKYCGKASCSKYR